MRRQGDDQFGLVPGGQRRRVGAARQQPVAQGAVGRSHRLKEGMVHALQPLPRIQIGKGKTETKGRMGHVHTHFHLPPGRV